MEQAKSSSEIPQYSLGKILLIWAAAAVPMGLIMWVLMPILIARVNIVPGFMTLPLMANSLNSFINPIIEVFVLEGAKIALQGYPTNFRQ